MKAQKLTRETIRHLGVADRNFPQFEIGDHVAVSQWITEGNKKRVQVFEGDVIAMHKKGASSTFTVRKIGAGSIAVERIYPFYSAIIDSIKVIRKGDVCRAKLYYLRDRIGKRAQVKEKVLTKEARAHMRAKAKSEAAKKAAEQLVKAAPEKAAKAEALKKEAEAAQQDTSAKEAVSDKKETKE
jgi:large subunit ribosomal protein L19